MTLAIINNNVGHLKAVPTNGMSYREMAEVFKGDWLKVIAGRKDLIDEKSKRYIMREKIARCLLESRNKPMTARAIGESLFSNRRSINLVSSYAQDMRHAGLLDRIDSNPAVYFFSENLVNESINKKPLTISELNEIVKSSPFKRNNYTVTLPLKGLTVWLMLYIDSAKDAAKSSVFSGVPSFQRDNDKWTVAMQEKFIENLIKGCKTTLMLYEIVKKGDSPIYDQCKILDGLQRITAIDGFIKGTVKAFGMTYDQLCAANIINRGRQYIDVRIYAFACELEAVDFYISMNENITHSPADIRKAKAAIRTANKSAI